MGGYSEILVSVREATVKKRNACVETYSEKRIFSMAGYSEILEFLCGKLHRRVKCLCRVLQ